MTDPWEDVRERDSDTDEWLERNWGWADTAGAGPSPHRLAHEDRKRILADATALLAGPHEMKLCLGLFKGIRNTPQNYLVAISTMAIDETIARLEKKLAALPEHLRG